ncbi:hypothetical protein I302_104528 [Kwoniella bestiolae CBS 10118]|uniref:Uncharacterized protein n=1 Tax=Kwoniella bestiolae CBS 10118 TaxID=1296100 RepID=A0A1B9GBH5_9TREE|nr:hypothetical protein I302_03234 [Kwoniella bestiolae CBS 10118]OCF28375.1 hypothetical protein I302_03234 [Kwoniella bestiolae CBS 10118]
MASDSGSESDKRSRKPSSSQSSQRPSSRSEGDRHRSSGSRSQPSGGASDRHRSSGGSDRPRTSGSDRHRSSGERSSSSRHGSGSSRESSSRSRPPRPIESDGTRGDEVARKCSHFRYYMLYTSGGWLGDLLITLTDVTGIWEFTFLSILFVASWTIMRINQVEITLILGKVYDLVIPLQHKFDPTKQKTHSNHLDQYWPLFLIGSIIEFGCFILVHPDLFTLVACLKTLVLTALWLGVDGKGRFLTEKFGGKNGRSDRSGGPASNDRGRDRDGARDRNGDGRSNKSDRSNKGDSNDRGDGKKDSSKKGSSSPTSAKEGDNAKKGTKDNKDDKGGSGSRDPYDSKGFTGNLMPIRKKAPDGPRESKRHRR